MQNDKKGFAPNSPAPSQWPDTRADFKNSIYTALAYRCIQDYWLSNPSRRVTLPEVEFEARIYMNKELQNNCRIDTKFLKTLDRKLYNVHILIHEQITQEHRATELRANNKNYHMAECTSEESRELLDRDTSTSCSSTAILFGLCELQIMLKSMLNIKLHTLFEIQKNLLTRKDVIKLRERQHTTPSTLEKLQAVKKPKNVTPLK
jgi:hypothetical protein